jgi:hypothetical protein
MFAQTVKIFAHRPQKSLPRAVKNFCTPLPKIFALAKKMFALRHFIFAQ